MPKSRPKFDDGPSVFEVPLPEPTTYHVIVRPRPAPTHLGSGLLQAAKRTQDADLAVRTIGQLVAIGALANKVATKDMDPMQDPVSQKMTVGDWVVYAQHAGQKLRPRKDLENLHVQDDGDPTKFFVLMNDTDILARFKTEADAVRWVDWI